MNVKGGNNYKIDLLWSAIMVEFGNVGVCAQVTRSLLIGPVSEELERVCVNLVVYVVTHLRHESVSAVLGQPCYGEPIHYET